MFKPVDPKPNFPEMEKYTLERWYKTGIVEKYLHKNDQAKTRFSFLDGPITANNPMGVHHGWGRTYKDLWQRYFNMKGYRERFQNGFDCQGLWIEVEVEKELGVRNKRDIENLVPGSKKKSIAKFVNLCKERVNKFSSIQREQSKRLGYFMDWDNSYFTMSDENNYMIWYFLKTCFEKGWIYKGRESVPWCPRCETAISQHEMLTEDYKELTHKSIYMIFPLEERAENILVWTTTPWTIPANIAIAVDKNFVYALVKDDDSKKFWVVKDAVERLFGSRAKVMKEVKGSDLIGLKYRGAFDDLPSAKKAAENSKFHTVIPTDPLIMPITTSEGTGLVHTAVSAGEEDFKLGKKLGLSIIPVIEDNADYMEGLGFLTGKNAKKHPEIILDFMMDKGFAWKIENYTHRYPACWRCKTELVWKVAEEWYIAMDRSSSQVQSSKIKVQNKKTLRERMMEVARKIKWIPEFGLERELDWLSNMSDWLISKKNRYWGLALPIYECKKCHWFTVVGSREELEKKAVSGWSEFEGKSPHKPYIDEVKIRCEQCSMEIKRIPDVGNVWLDAGIVPYSTYLDPITKTLSYTSDRKYWGEWFPADFITESFPGQFKNWFYSMIAMSAVLENEPPYKTVLGYASVLGEDARPMHKSWGNAIEFNEAADKIGVDVMRWMYVTQNPTINLLFGYKTADETRRKFHLLLWNIYNFFVTYANLDKNQRSKIKDQKSDVKSTNILDRWILSRLNNTIKTATTSLDLFDAYTASNSIQKFVEDLSLWYIRRSRDRASITNTDKSDKEEFYRTTYYILVTLAKLMAPFIPFVSEEIYGNLTNEESVHLASWPVFEEKMISPEIEKLMQEVREMVEKGHAIRKANHIKVRQPLKQFKMQNTKSKIGEEYLTLIKDELNVKKVSVEEGNEELKVSMDIKLTPELIEEGQARELIRQIQIKRREIGCRLDEVIEVAIPQWPDKYTGYIKKETLTNRITKGKEFIVKKI